MTACDFDKVTTLPIILFEVFVLMGSVGALFVLGRLTDHLLKRFVVVLAGVLIFEVFTSPMWLNYKLGTWAYIYQDVSWVLAVGWSALILTIVTAVDHIFSRWSTGRRFALYLVVLTALVFVLEAIVVGLGIRRYSPEVLETVIGVFVAGVPLEALYYVPVFMTLVICLYKYWAFRIDDELLVPVGRTNWVRNLLLTAGGVLLFELMIEPMVVNANFPRWSYIYNDITFLMTGIWVVLISLATIAVDRFFVHWSIRRRFVAYILAVGALALPLESFFIRAGFRVYGPSAEANFTGFVTPITNVAAEIAFAIPLYMALIIAFVRFWEIVGDQQRAERLAQAGAAV
jgi:hypothetical protein